MSGWDLGDFLSQEKETKTYQSIDDVPADIRQKIVDLSEGGHKLDLLASLFTIPEDWVRVFLAGSKGDKGN